MKRAKGTGRVREEEGCGGRERGGGTKPMVSPAEASIVDGGVALVLVLELVAASCPDGREEGEGKVARGSFLSFSVSFAKDVFDFSRPC